VRQVERLIMVQQRCQLGQIAECLQCRCVCAGHMRAGGLAMYDVWAGRAIAGMIYT